MRTQTKETAMLTAAKFLIQVVVGYAVGVLLLGAWVTIVRSIRPH